jgi:hypothetical protein
MLEALESAQSKLREYYGRTDENELGDIYAHGTILAPQHKLQFFQTKDWTGDYAASYLESLQHRMKTYQTNSDSTSKPQVSSQISDFDQWLTDTPTPAQEQDELSQYLQRGKPKFRSLLL